MNSSPCSVDLSRIVDIALLRPYEQDAKMCNRVNEPADRRSVSMAYGVSRM
jgi:hypothetical protein